MSNAPNQEQFVIEGGHRLSGEVAISGNKNAALKMIPACLLTQETVILDNVPDIQDVRIICAALESLGAKIVWLDEKTLEVDSAQITSHIIAPEYATKIRASMVLAGPLLARLGKAELAPPGGDVIGRRRVDTHILALKALGAEVEFDRVFKMKTSGLKGANILLDEASVTATENTVMAAVTAKGTTVIRNAASEPHVQDLCIMLNAMGAKIGGEINLRVVPILDDLLNLRVAEEWEVGDFAVGVGKNGD